MYTVNRCEENHHWWQWSPRYRSTFRRMWINLTEVEHSMIFIDQRSMMKTYCRWQGYLPLRHAGPGCCFRVSRSNSRMMCWCRREKICQGKAMMHPFTWRETKMIWRTDIGLTQRWSIGQRVKIATLSWSGYRTHKGRPIDDGGMIVTLVELLLNKRHDTLAALTRLKNYRPKFEKGMTSKESTDLPNTRHKCEGRCRVQEWLLPRLHSIFLFQIPQPYGWVLLSCFTSSREITDARYKPILRMSPPKYF